jgi:AcrR family transcriptional regulator
MVAPTAAPTAAPAAPAAPAMRSDARRNREKLLHAAAEQFAMGGANAPLETIARAAGVGIGTLYRHFPTRDALIEAVYLEQVDQLCAAADELLAEHPADDALARWMDRFVVYAVRKRGLSGALKSIATANAELVPSTRGRLLATIERFLDHGRRSGCIRADVDREDVLRAMSAAWAMPEGEEWAANATRLLGLLIDGLRFGT